MLRPSENLTGESTERDTWIHAAHTNCTNILTCASIDSKLNTKPPYSEAERPPSFIHTAVDFQSRPGFASDLLHCLQTGVSYLIRPGSPNALSSESNDLPQSVKLRWPSNSRCNVLSLRCCTKKVPSGGAGGCINLGSGSSS